MPTYRTSNCHFFPSPARLALMDEPCDVAPYSAGYIEAPPPPCYTCDIDKVILPVLYSGLVAFVLYLTYLFIK